MQTRLRFGRVVPAAIIVALLFASTLRISSAEAQAKERAATMQTEPLPLSKVAEYMNVYHQNTTIKNRKLAKDLVGRVYTGVMEVLDVNGDDKSLTVWARSSATQPPPRLFEFVFRINKPEIIKKAAELPKGAKILITAKLRFVSPSQASFDETQSVDIAPAEKLPPKN